MLEIIPPNCSILLQKMKFEHFGRSQSDHKYFKLKNIGLSWSNTVWRYHQKVSVSISMSSLYELQIRAILFMKIETISVSEPYLYCNTINNFRKSGPCTKATAWSIIHIIKRSKCQIPHILTALTIQSIEFSNSVSIVDSSWLTKDPVFAVQSNSNLAPSPYSWQFVIVPIVNMKVEVSPTVPCFLQTLSSIRRGTHQVRKTWC